MCAICALPFCEHGRCTALTVLGPRPRRWFNRLLGETLGPDGALMGTEMPEALETAHASVTILQMSSLLVSWWLVWARFFYFI